MRGSGPARLVVMLLALAARVARPLVWPGGAARRAAVRASSAYTRRAPNTMLVDPGDLIKLTGIVKDITFRSPDNGYTVARFGVDAPSDGAESADDTMGTMVLRAQNGALASAVAGQQLQIVGRWVEHAQYGAQVEVESTERVERPPHVGGDGGIAEIEGLLCSSAVRGIGPKTAKGLVAKFGERTLVVLRGEGSADEQAALERVPGMSEAKVRRVRDALSAYATLESAIAFGRSLGCLSEPQVATLAREMGDEAESKLRANPYALLEMFPSLGFQAVDHVARSALAVPADDLARAGAALHHCLRRALGNGHCCAPKPRLSRAAAKVLVCEGLGAEEALAAVDAALAGQSKDGQLVQEKPPRRQPGAKPPPPVVSLPEMSEAERFVADAVRRRLQPGAAFDDVYGRYAPAAADFGGGLGGEAVGEAMTPFMASLAPSQLQAVRQSQSSKLLVLTGGPGTGKTHTVRAVVERWRAAGKRVLMACPTARAATVLSSAVGQPASTIHRLLEYNPREEEFARNAANPLEADAVVVDEASMLDVHLAGALFHALPAEADILIVGDDDQLPSVGPGAVLHDLLSCPRVPRVTLSAVFRQDPSGDIARNAVEINAGAVPSHLRTFDNPAALGRAAAAARSLAERPSGCVMVRAGTEASAAEAIAGPVLDWLQESGYDLHEEVQVLTPMKRGAAGTITLNRRLKERLNPRNATRDAAPTAAPRLAEAAERARAQSSDYYGAVEAAREAERLARGRPKAPTARGQDEPSVGDHMIQLTNDYDNEVFNGDVGRVAKVWHEGRALRFSVAFRDRVATAATAAAAKRIAGGGSELTVEYTKSNLGKDVALSYALTVHKAQGSEYPVVVMPVLPQHRAMLYRNLLYTGFSRAKQLLVLVGADAAVRTAVENDAQVKRVTLLAERINDKTFAPPTTRHMSEW